MTPTSRMDAAAGAATPTSGASAPTAVTDAELSAKYSPVFAAIAEGARDRERGRVLPFEQVGWLADAGFGAVRVPREFGGDGASITQLTRLLIALAAADSNVPQALRGHIAFVEDRLYAAAGPARDAWLRRFAAGELVGNAWTEIGSNTLGVSATRVIRQDAAESGSTDAASESEPAYLLNGSKYYTTGSIYAQWMDVTARDGNDLEVTALVSTAHGGVAVSDDWDGFGQRLTGSGAAVFTDARVEASNVFPFSERFPYQTALYQLVLLATLAGIARAVEQDAGAEVRGRTRVYSHGNTAQTKDDPQIQQAVGEISARAYGAASTTLAVGASLQRAWEAHVARISPPDLDAGPGSSIGAGTDGAALAEAEHAANVAAEIESAQAQVVVIDLVLKAASDLFNVLGASGVSTTRALDRHWRNARTVASHNPLLFKARIVGDWVINDTPPPFLWSIGTPPPATAATPA